ncbi:MAG: ice-binding family protein [Sulfuricaulis sp.]|nr:ice-binding family protein [Sulfuricaulis sp.]
MNRIGSFFKPLMWLMALLLAAFVAGCGGGGGGSTTAGTGTDTGTSTSSGAAGGVCTGSATDCVSLGTGGNLGAAAGYAILAKDGVSTVPSSVVTGNVGLSPTARVGLTDWSETAASDASDLYSTSAQVVAPFRLYAADYAVPTPSNLTTAVLSMEAAYTDAAGRPATSAATTNLGSGTLTSQTLTAGVYEWGSAVTIPTDLTFNGSATDVWILKVAGTLDMAAAKNVILAGGAKAQNIFWQVSDVVTIGANTHFEGIILAKTKIAMLTNSSINGRLLAQTEVTLDATTVTQPTP